MSLFKSFAVWGSGNQGKHIINELLAIKAKQTDIIVSVLTRPESKDNENNAAFASAGAIIVPFDVTSATAFESLKDIDVFICAQAAHAGPLQPQAAQAASKAGVKLFVPSDWGNDVHELHGAWYQVQQAAHRAAVAEGLPTASFFCGLWIGAMLWFGFDLPNGKINLAGDGKAKISITSTEDVGRFVAHALTAFPKEKLQGGKFYLQGDYIAPLDLANALQSASSKPLEISFTPEAVIQSLLQKAIAENDVRTQTGMDLTLDVIQGKSVLDQDKVKATRALYPEWTPTNAVDYLKAFLPK